jgi:hypothetical protein
MWHRICSRPFQNKPFERSYKDESDGIVFNSRCLYRTAIPNAEVAVVFYDQGLLHNRFLLTDIGGVMWGTGLDEQGGSDRRTDTDELIVLKKHLYDLHWKKWNCEEESI